LGTAPELESISKIETTCRFGVLGEIAAAQQWDMLQLVRVLVRRRQSKPDRLKPILQNRACAVELLLAGTFSAAEGAGWREIAIQSGRRRAIFPYRVAAGMS